MPNPSDPTIPPMPTPATCDLLVSFMNTQPGYSVHFQCNMDNTPANCVQACAEGGPEVNAMCNATGTQPQSQAMIDFLGYGSYECGLQTGVATDCGCEHVWGPDACPAPSPPPSPPPPACGICSVFCASGDAPPPTQSTCDLLVQFMDSQPGSSGAYFCDLEGAPPGCVQACADGGLEVNDVCNALGNEAGASAIFAAIGYGEYSCDVQSILATSCGCQHMYGPVACSLPPPSPNAIQLVNPPAPPAPPGADPFFPYCGCQRQASSPYSFNLTSVTPGSEGDVVCGVVRTQSCDGPDSCCSADLYKAAFHINDQCSGAVEWTTYGGKVRYPSFERQYGPGRTIFKVTQMQDLNANNADGLEICFQLRAPCMSLSEFCFGGDQCEVALFDSKNLCCPTASLPPPVL